MSITGHAGPRTATPSETRLPDYAEWAARTRRALRRGSSLGNLLMVLGLLSLVAGVVLWVAFILWGITLDGAAVAASANPFAAAPTVLGLPQPVLGLVLLTAGSLSGALGAAMSRAARRRRGDLTTDPAR